MRLNFSSQEPSNNQKPVSSKQAFSSITEKLQDGLLSLTPKKKQNSRFNVSNTFIEPEIPAQETITEELLEAEQLKKAYEEQKKEKSDIKKEKLINYCFLAGCIYFCFLTFGVWVTDYHYDDNGKIIAQQMSYQDIVQKKSFEVLLDHYVTCRDLYEKALIIDKKLALKEAEPFTLAPEYELLVTEAEILYTKTEALSIDAKYEQIRSMMLLWIKDDFATYCKNMSTAISQNNGDVANTALVNRETTYADFSLITQNLIAMGDIIPGVNLVNVKEWNAANIYNN